MAPKKNKRATPSTSATMKPTPKKRFDDDDFSDDDYDETEELAEHRGLPSKAPSYGEVVSMLTEMTHKSDKLSDDYYKNCTQFKNWLQEARDKNKELEAKLAAKTEKTPATTVDLQKRIDELEQRRCEMDRQQATIDAQRAEMEAQRAVWAEQRATLERLEATMLQQQRTIAELQEQLKKRPRPADTTSEDDSAPAREPKKKQKRTTVPQDNAKPSTSTARSDENELPESDEDTPEAMETETPRTDEQRRPRSKVPPVVMRDKDGWQTVSKELASRGHNYSKARLVTDGIEIQPVTGDDHRGITKFLDQKKVGYHTYSLPEEQSLRVVVRGIPDGVTDEEVKADLISQGYAVQAAHRMTHRATRTKMPLVLVKMPLGQESVLQVTRCCALAVRVERQRTTSLATQCHRCQRFGHAQSKCTAVARCVKCGSAHRSGDCRKPREEPARCANCQGAHTASYRGCPNFPKPNKKLVGRPATTTPAPRRTRPTAQETATRREATNVPQQRSYAQATAGASTTTTTADKRTNMVTAMAAMQQMMQTMMTLMASMSG